MTFVSQSFHYLIHIIFYYYFIKGLYGSPDFFLLEQLQKGRRNKVIWVHIVSQFMQPLIHQEKSRYQFRKKQY